MHVACPERLGMGSQRIHAGLAPHNRSRGLQAAPGGMVNAVNFRLFLKPPFDKRLWYEISFGCEGSQVSRMVKTVSTDDLWNAYSAFLSSDQGHQDGHVLARIVFGADDETQYAEGF